MRQAGRGEVVIRARPVRLPGPLVGRLAVLRRVDESILVRPFPLHLQGEPVLKTFNQSGIILGKSCKQVPPLVAVFLKGVQRCESLPQAVLH